MTPIDNTRKGSIHRQCIISFVGKTLRLFTQTSYARTCPAQNSYFLFFVYINKDWPLHDVDREQW